MALTAGAALAAAGHSRTASSVIHACRTKTGLLRVVGPPGACRASERRLSWSVRGAKGDSGPAGASGAIGPAGPAGESGLRGASGASGATGAAGSRGASGPPGPSGATGPPGPRGATGPAGPLGATGPKGDPGEISSLDALAGLSCTVDGKTGASSLTYDDESRAVLTCVIAAGSPVRINEFSTGVASAAANEFVELFNPGSVSVDLSGYRLVYRSAAGTADVVLATIPATTTVAAGGYYLFGGSAYAGAVRPDQTFTTGLASSGGGLGLRSADGNLVDSVGYGSATSNAFVEGAPAPAPPATAVAGSSDVRIPDGHDTGDNSVDFTISATPTPRSSNG
jgi:hypothetical protein